MQLDYQNPRVRARIEKATIGINQQKKVIIKQRLTSSVSIFFTSPYLIIMTAPSAAIPTTTIDQPTISHLKKSDIIIRSFLEQWNIKTGMLEKWSDGMLGQKIDVFKPIIPSFQHSTIPCLHIPFFHHFITILLWPEGCTFSSVPENLAGASPPPRLPLSHSTGDAPMR
jgi:hypothetical protein